MMLVYGGSLAWESVSIWEHSNSAWGVALYPFKMMIPLGALFLLLQGLAKLIRDILTAFGISAGVADEGRVLS
jgi:TRAP-type mannitol/chloroaromatic compound transport system permease small subunit